MWEMVNFDYFLRYLDFCSKIGTKKRFPLKDRLFNFVDKSCVTPTSYLPLENASRRKHAATVFPGFLETIFVEFSESSTIFNFHQKFAEISCLEVRNVGIPSLFLDKCKGTCKGNVEKK